MSSILAAVLALAATPPDASLNATAVVPTSQSAQRTAQELREAVHQTLRRWARPTDEQADQAAAEFLALYREVESSDQLSTAQREYLRTRVRSRLMKVAQQIAKREAIKRRLAREAQPAGVGVPADRAGVLAQRGGFGGGVGPGMGGMGGMGAGGFGGGGFGGGGFGMGGGVLGPADYDHGQELVDLIQKTISPGSWDINGGPGSIYYWRPGRAIVVRQTDEVHGRLGDVLQQMGRMGP